MQKADVDTELLTRFDSEVLARIPHLAGGKVADPTPLVEVTDAVLECAKTEYGLDLSPEGVRVFAKMDSKLAGAPPRSGPSCPSSSSPR